MKDEKFEQKIRSKFDNFEEEVPDLIWSNIEQRLPRGEKVVFKSMYRYMAAVAAILIGLAILFQLQTESENEEIKPLLVSSSTPSDIIPTDKAEGDPTTENPKISTAYPIQQTPARLEGISYRETKNFAVQTTLQDKPIEKLSLRSRNNQTKEESTNLSTHSQQGDRTNYRTRWYQNNTAERDMLLNSRQTDTDESRNIGLSVSLLTSNISTESTSTIAVQRVKNQLNMFKLLTASSLFALEDEPLSYKHNMPLKTGIMIEKRIFRYIGIESGLTYSFLKSSYENQRKTLQGKQELHYLGIPLNLMYHIAEWGNLQIYTGIGGEINFNVSSSKTDKLLSANQKGEELFEVESTSSKSVRDQVQWSVSCKAGLAYTVVSFLDVYAEPSFSYYFKNHSNVENIWKERPGNFALQIGLRASF